MHARNNVLHNEVLSLVKEVLAFCVLHVDRSLCDDALRQIIGCIYAEVTNGLNGLYKGHIEQLAIYLNDKMKKVEFIFEGKLRRRDMGEVAGRVRRARG